MPSVTVPGCCRSRCPSVHYLVARFNNTGHVLHGRTDLDRVDADDLVAEASSWDMGKVRARATVTDVLAATWEAAHQVALPEGAEGVMANLERLWARRCWRPPTT